MIGLGRLASRYSQALARPWMGVDVHYGAEPSVQLAHACEPEKSTMPRGPRERISPIRCVYLEGAAFLPYRRPCDSRSPPSLVYSHAELMCGKGKLQVRLDSRRPRKVYYKGLRGSRSIRVSHDRGGFRGGSDVCCTVDLKRF